MENENIVTLQVKITRGRALLLLALFFLCWHPGPLGSETLQLTTYYPAPYGGYVSLMTTNRTILAREPLSTTPTSRVGIGNVNPASKLDITGTGNTTVDLRVNGRMQTGDANGNGGMWLSSASDGFVGNVANNIGFWTNGAGWNALQIVKATGFVGIGTTAPATRFNVVGDTQINGNLAVLSNGWLSGLCTEVGYGGGISTCPGGRRVIAHYGTGRTFAGNIFLGGSLNSPSQWIPHYEQGTSGTMLCCNIRNF